ncbi:MAG: hypothetical protein ACRDE5_03185, partial [Ginsengibacter sp.]
MSKTKFSFPFLICLLWILLYVSCNNNKRHSGQDIARSPKELQQKATSHIDDLLHLAKGNKGKIDDSTSLVYFKPVEMVYEKNQHELIWSKNEQWLPLGDSLYNFIQNSKLYGLFPEDYHFGQLSSIHTLFYNDNAATSDRKDAALWARADLLLTDAFFHIVKDIKLGRLPQDSISMRKDSVLTDAFYIRQFDSLMQSNALTSTIHELEPHIKA